MPEIEIRPAQQTDFEKLRSIDLHSMSDYVWQMDRAIQESQVGIVFREVRLPRSIRIEHVNGSAALARFSKSPAGVLVAAHAGELVGYICIEEKLEARSAWVHSLAVAEPFRRQGIACALVLASQDWALKRGMRRMVIEMHSKNHPAIRLAIKLGFEFSGYHDQYYANQDIALFFSRLLR